MNDRTRTETKSDSGTDAATGITRVFDTMGTTVSVVLGGRSTPGLIDEAVRQVTEIFRAADERYSLYRPESELSRLSRGELMLPDASWDLRQMYDLAIAWRTRTNGAFTPHQGDGTTDLSGVVKAWAMAQAGTVLTAGGLHPWCINAGGDVLTSRVGATKPWTVGIINPADRTALLASVRLPEALPAIATSGSAERGQHIWPHTENAPGQFVQVSVIGPDILTADVLATAIIAGGQETMNLATSTWPVELLAVGTDGDLVATPGFSRLLAK